MSQVKQSLLINTEFNGKKLNYGQQLNDPTQLPQSVIVAWLNYICDAYGLTIVDDVNDNSA